MSLNLLNIFLKRVALNHHQRTKGKFNREESIIKGLADELIKQVKKSKLKFMSFQDMISLCEYRKDDPISQYADEIEWLSSQWNISADPPKLGYYHLTLDDVRDKIGANIVHEKNKDLLGKPLTGKGVRVGIVDTGWYDHPFFEANDLQPPSVAISFTSAGRPVRVDPSVERDGNKLIARYNPIVDQKGHGTAMAANLLAIAPKAIVKMYQKDGAYLHALKRAVQENDIVSLSSSPTVGELEGANTAKHYQDKLDEIFKIADERNVIIFVANGNYTKAVDEGKQQPPGLIKYYRDKVIAVGGVYVDQNGESEASDYALAHGRDYGKGGKKRHVETPDICALVGKKPHGTYILLPTYPGCKADRDYAPFDKTKPNDGWVVISGTSSATPQVVGVCALMKQLNPTIAQDQVKSMLRDGGIQVNKGKSADGVEADGDWSRLVYAPRAIALVEELVDDKVEEEISVGQSHFAIHAAASKQPVLLNGMKVIFDEVVPVQPVNLIPKDKPSIKAQH